MEGAAQTLVSTVGQLLGEEFRQLRGVSREVAALRDEVATMNAVLRMQSEADDGVVDHFVREWMKQVRELAYDAEDCVDLYIFRIRCQPGDRFLVWSKRLLATLFPRHRLAGDIKDLRDRAVAISERHVRYAVSREALRRSPLLEPVPATAVSAHALRPADDPDQFVGINDQASVLAEKVKAVKDQEHDMKLKVFSVVGFGGLGKTTLAMEVCRQLEGDFQRQAQVSVSQAFDGSKNLRGLLIRVLQQIAKVKAADNATGVEEEASVCNIDSMDVDALADTLKETLKDKRYLIVVDDVWTIAAWDAIQSKLSDNKCGSRIIVTTTRIESVAKACSEASVCADSIYRIEPLNPYESEKLFLSKTFGSKDLSCPKELEGEMDKILKKCGGLPLAIVSIAGLLASYNKSPGSKDMWERVCRSIGSQMNSNPTLEGMRQILTLSYSHLPYHLKACMLYLAIFPEDYVINKDRLLYKWISEGLVEEKRGLTQKEVAEGYFEELMSRNMIDPVAIMWNDGKTDACRVHDMMLEVMVSKSLEANFVSLVGDQYEAVVHERIRRLSIHGVIEKEDVAGSPSKKMGRRGKRNNTQGMDVQHVRSLAMFESDGKLLDRLGEFTLLRVLDLEDSKGLENKHIEHICRMYLLRFLSVKGTDITVLPQKIGDLEHLQRLDARDTLVSDIPTTVTKLEKLESLLYGHRHEWSLMWKLPRGLSRMRALREMTKTAIGNDVEVAKEMGQLGQLRLLGIYVDAPVSSCQEMLQVLALSLSKLHSLRSVDLGHMSQGRKTLDFLHQLPSVPRLLQRLRMDGGFSRLPSWIESLTNLVEFISTAAYLVDDQLFGVLCKLPNLQIIVLNHNNYLNTELVARTQHSFPSLRNLRLSCDWDMPNVLSFQQGSMPKLESLWVNFGNRKRSIVGVEHLKNLKVVQLTGNKDNHALQLALEQLKAEKASRSKPDQFKIAVAYD